MERNGSSKRVWAACSVLAAVLLSWDACAALGEPESAVTVDAQQLKGSIRSTPLVGYTVHAIALPSGTVLREYAASGGTIFAVAWSGPVIPNLRQAMGQYFPEFANAAKSNRAGHTHLEIRQNDLVVQSSGHMRAFTGRAYLPQGLPPGISLQEIQ